MSLYSQEVSSGARKLVIVLVLISAVFMIGVQPFMTAPALDTIQVAQFERIDKFYAEGNPAAPLIENTPAMVGFFFAQWTMLSFIGGLVLFIIAKPLYNGVKWAKAIALICLAMPSIGGAYMLVPWMNFVSSSPDAGFPPAVIIMAAGLIPYFAIVMAGKSSAIEKAILFTIFTLLGVAAAYTFGNGHAAHRILIGHPMLPQYGPDIFVLNYARTAGWIAVLGLTAAIYLLAMRKEVGWWIGLSAGAVTGFTGLLTHYYRHVTVDYLLQGLAGLAIVAILLIPMVKRLLIGNVEQKGTISEKFHSA
ncbi:MAG: hypothetical protein APF76_03380 [Desulfitibacter sp. BRH_c19]|nr:MAG: hypothetical protein APF76_03380 [Desulfitibacter sp. BRH_c19]